MGLIVCEHRFVTSDIMVLSIVCVGMQGFSDIYDNIKCVEKLDKISRQEYEK